MKTPPARITYPTRDKARKWSQTALETLLCALIGAGFVLLFLLA